MLETLTRDDFVAQLNTKFVVAVGPAQQAELELIDVGAKRPTPKLDNYALLFRGPSEFCLLQNVFRLGHEQLDGLELLLVPVNEKPDGFRYEAIINRLVP